MGSDFVAKYISLAEGEKDPRNLLTAFAIARVILIEFDTTDYVEVRAPPISPRCQLMQQPVLI